MARQVKGSNNRRKTRKRLARTFEYAKEIRKDVIHKATHFLVSEPVRTIRDAMSETEHGPRPDSTGRSCRPAGVYFLSYKSLQSGKLVIKLSPQYSSQRCGLTDNADHNGSRVIAHMGSVFFWKGRSRRKRFGGAGSGNSKHHGRKPVSKPPERAIRRKGPQSFAHPRRKRNIPLVRAETPP
ncbi:MAG: hypothetical protein ACYCT9_08670 [Leptospirillum sp.]